MLKKLKKKILKENSHKYRLKYLLKKLFGYKFLEKHRKWKYFKKKFSFFKNKLDKKIDGQSIIKNEKGFLLNFVLNNYLSYHLRPKSHIDFNLESTCKINEKFAIIVQGPIEENFDFLRHTIKIYKKIFKNSKIIISTWETENKNFIDKLNNENVDIILNKKIENSKLNLSRQITTTRAALDFAKSHDIKYCLKTRTDQRIHNYNLETFLLSIINTFPVKKNNLTNSRLVVLPIGTRKFFLYHLSDLTMFGQTDDLINYWDKESYEIGLKKIGLSEENWFINGTPLCAETFLCSRFINRIEGKITWDLNNWWRCLKDYFCVIDNSSLDCLWFKYDWDVEYRNIKTYSDKITRSVDFHDWLSLYNNYQNDWDTFSKEHEKYEKYNDHIRGLNLFNK